MSFFSIIFLNVNSSFTIQDRLLKFSVGIVDILIEGNMSQIFYLSPGSSFMRFQK